MKEARLVTWSDVEGHDASLVRRCTAGDQIACADLVNEHQRMVVQLAMNLLGDRDEALDLSQEVFLRVFRTIHRFRGQSSLINLDGWNVEDALVKADAAQHDIFKLIVCFRCHIP